MSRSPLGWRDLYGVVLLRPFHSFGLDRPLAPEIPCGKDWHRGLLQHKTTGCRYRRATAVCWCLLQRCKQLPACTTYFEPAHDPEQAMLLHLQFYH